jgi:hypothetical protein
MKNRTWMRLFGLILATSSSATFAQTSICVFDLLGKSGESYKFLEEWALNTKTWGTAVKLIAYQDEAKADQAFKDGRCDGVYMTSMRARHYNKFAGSIDALGGVSSNQIAQKAISYVLDKRNNKRLVSTLEQQQYEVAGIAQIGSAYIFVRDRKINNIDQIKNKKFAVLHFDAAQRIMVERIGAVPVMSDISNFVRKFNQGEVDIVAAPAYAFKPLEIQKGLGQNGAMIDFPVVNVTVDLIIRPEKFNANFADQSRTWFKQQTAKNFAMVKRLEADIPARYRLTLSKDEREKYQKILRDGRIELRKQGVYDPTMMTMLKRARCTVERTNFECSLAGE